MNPWNGVKKIDDNILQIDASRIPKLEHCNCKGNCDDLNECCCLRRNRQLHNSLYEQNQIPIYECSPFCTCAKQSCSLFKYEQMKRMNSVEHKTCIQRTSHKGYGLFAKTGFAEGDYVIEYIGEMIRTEEADKRTIQYRNENRRDNYMLEVKEHYNNVTIRTCIDATHFGNESRFVNHSCDPNCSIQIIRTSSFLPHIILIANKSIKEGEEITFHYGGEGISTNSTPCYCGCNNCCGYIPFSC